MYMNMCMYMCMYVAWCVYAYVYVHVYRYVVVYVRLCVIASAVYNVCAECIELCWFCVLCVPMYTCMCMCICMCMCRGVYRPRPCGRVPFRRRAMRKCS